MIGLRDLGGKIAVALGHEPWIGFEMVSAFQEAMKETNLFQKTGGLGHGKGGPGRSNWEKVVTARSADAVLLTLALGSGFTPKKALPVTLLLFGLPAAPIGISSACYVACDGNPLGGLDFNPQLYVAQDVTFGESLTNAVNVLRRVGHDLPEDHPCAVDARGIERIDFGTYYENNLGGWWANLLLGDQRGFVSIPFKTPADALYGKFDGIHRVGRSEVLGGSVLPFLAATLGDLTTQDAVNYDQEADYTAKDVLQTALEQKYPDAFETALKMAAAR